MIFSNINITNALPANGQLRKTEELMMKRLIVSVMVITILFAAGCAPPPKPEFDQTYLPNTVPGSPQKRIDLPKLVTDKALVRKWGLFSNSTTYLPTSLYWVEEDNLLFNITSEDNKSLLYSFLIIPSTGEIKLLEGAEKDALLGEIDKNTSFVSSETTGNKVLKGVATALIIALQVAAAAAGGGGSGSGPNFSEDYKGKIENNGTVLNFDISIKKKGGGAFSSAYYACGYAARNSRTGTTLKGDSRFADDSEGGVEHEVKEWLKSWRVSPDGRYYVIGSTATFVDPEEEYAAFANLIKNYDRAYDGFDINPRWDKIALLNIKKDDKTKQMNYWIEFYPFDYRNIKMTEQYQRGNARCCSCFLPAMHGEEYQ
jgi:hypothetical protein